MQILKKLGYIFYLLLITLMLFEVVLHIYNPLNLRVKGSEIVLPINEHYEFQNSKNPQLESHIVHTKNALGFRGENLPADTSKLFKIITVGGSTTECYFVSDESTWAYVLGQKLKKDIPNLWLNNAGLNGQSTFGHQLLMNKYIAKLKPDVVIFLFGVNDVNRNDLNQFDSQMSKESNSGLKEWFMKNSELASIFVNVKRSMMARSLMGGHKVFDELPLPKRETLELTQEYIENELQKQRNEVLPHYKERVNRLIQICKQHQIQPVFLTQPLFYGIGKDSTTNIDLTKIKVTDTENGELFWKKLELFNQTTRQLAQENNILLIDLAQKMPRRVEYYYDSMHYTKQGCDKVSEIVYQGLSPTIKTK
jgi:lysophospholipase L1-like esterase